MYQNLKEITGEINNKKSMEKYVENKRKYGNKEYMWSK